MLTATQCWVSVETRVTVLTSQKTGPREPEVCLPKAPAVAAEGDLEPGLNSAVRATCNDDWLSFTYLLG